MPRWPSQVKSLTKAIEPLPQAPPPEKANGKHIDFSLIDWEGVPMSEGLTHLSGLQTLWEHATSVLRQRQTAADVVECACGCGKVFPPSHACMSETRTDEKTRLHYNVYYATQECVRQRNKTRQGIAELPR